MREQLIDFLNTDEWPWRESADGDFVLTAYHGDNGQFDLVYRLRSEHAQLICYAICPLDTPFEKRQTMAELLTRINYELTVGNFELDFEDGELRFRTSIDVEDDALNLILIRNLTYANVLTLDNYLPSLYAAMLTELSAAQALALVNTPDDIGDDIWQMLWALVATAIPTPLEGVPSQ